MTEPTSQLYTLTQAQDDVATTAGQVDRMSEALTQGDVTDQPNVPAAGNIQYSSSGHQRYVSSADGATYNTGRNSQVLTGSQITINSTSATDICTALVAAGRYHFHGQIIWTQGSTQAQQAMRFNGTATISTMGGVILHDYDAGVNGNNVVSTFFTAYNTDSSAYGAAGIPANTASWWRFDGTVAFSTSGNFRLQARCVTSSADTFKVFPDYSYIDMLPVTSP